MNYIKILAKVAEKTKLKDLNARFVFMEILLMAATEHELHAKFKDDSSAGKVDILIGGIGIASTTYHLTKSLIQKKYDLVIQAGIAGTFTNDLYPGEVVLVDADTFADAGIEENGLFRDLFASGLADKNAFPYEDGWLVNKHQLCNNLSLKKVKGITVNKITDNKMQIDRQSDIYNAKVESMEGAALHYVCLQLNTAFLQIRSISNVVGERNKDNWKMKEAIDNLNTVLLNTIPSLSKID